MTVGFDARHRVSIFVWLTASLRAGGGVPSLNLQARQCSEYPITRIKFSPYEPDRLLSCGRENVRFWRISKRRHLAGSAVESTNSNLHWYRGVEFTDLAFEATGGNISGSFGSGNNHGSNGGGSDGVGRVSIASKAAIDEAFNEANPRLVFVASALGTLVQIAYETRQVLGVLRLHDAPIKCIAAATGYVATGAADGCLRLWPLDFSDVLMQAKHDAAVTGAVITNDGMQIYTMTAGGEG